MKEDVMNVFVFEWKREWKQSLIWLISLGFVQLMFLLGMYPIFMDSKVNMTEVLNNFPEPFMKAFSFQIDSFYQFESFYGFGMTYVSLIGIIMSLTISISIYSREKRAKCTDFILTKPMRREFLFLVKTAVGLTCLLIIHISFLLLSIFIYYSMNLEIIDMRGFFLATNGLFLLEIMFLFVGAVISLTIKKIRSVSGTAVTLGFSIFIINAIVNLLEKENLIFFAVLQYFDAETIMKNNQYELKMLFYCIVITISCLIYSLVRFSKMQVKAIT
jgi:ABC-2 type transport system permease protein